jgi:hypothetical protein
MLDTLLNVVIMKEVFNLQNENQLRKTRSILRIMIRRVVIEGKSIPRLRQHLTSSQRFQSEIQIAALINADYARYDGNFQHQKIAIYHFDLVTVLLVYPSS